MDLYYTWDLNYSDSNNQVLSLKGRFAEGLQQKKVISKKSLQEQTN